MNDAPEPQRNHRVPPGAAARPARGVATLARDLSDFLVEFSIVLHKRAMYPTGHPHLEERHRPLRPVVSSPCSSTASGSSIGVARHQLIIGGVATEARNALLSDLARRLHRQRVASLRFERGVTRWKSTSCSRGLTREPGEDTASAGVQLERDRRRGSTSRFRHPSSAGCS